MKGILVVILLGLSLVMTACSSESSKQESENDFPPTMTGTIEVNGQQYDMAMGNYRWERKRGMETEVIETDSASPYQIAENFDAIQIGQSDTIHINIEDEPTITAYLWDENGRQKEVSVNNNQIKAPESAGKDVYEILAEWSNGEVSYTFVVEIQ
ncbi:hypothetical protein KD050_07220 [Psychrobacillus sp. INOP01]|uniref:hypothetical protein n=1 Tax=Psychrobacillus sp. INOP01 TaxID=2829187 RepID=UPI001BA92C6D|nr:hypothetical protein [Psychrobacillus sp. INOP01]QUG43019.1 hypothetical protein KD050_07220 [Psychrobacillus sp. INOP01]